MTDSRLPARETTDQTWGILIANQGTDIDVVMTADARRRVMAICAVFSVLFLLAFLAVFRLCRTPADAADSAEGVLHGARSVPLLLQGEPGRPLRVEEVRTQESLFIASGQPILSYSDGRGATRAFTSPVSGVVNKLEIDRPNGRVRIEVVPLHPLTFVAQVPEHLLGSLTVGQACNLSLTAYPDRKIPGVVAQIGARGEYRADLGHSLFPVHITIENPRHELRIGMSGSVTF